MKNKVKEYMKQNKKRIIFTVSLLILFTGVLIFMRNNHFLYQDTIIRITNIDEVRVEEEFGIEPIFHQTITARVMNGNAKGTIVYFEHERTYSMLTDSYFRVGNELFVDSIEDITTTNIIEVKRDFYVVLIMAVFLLLLVLITKKKSLMIMSSIIVNMFIFFLITLLRGHGINILFLFIIGSILSTIITLLIVCGKNKKTLGAIISTLITVLITMIISFIVINHYQSTIRFEAMPFIAHFPDFAMIFYSGILICGLGAIMDISVLMSTSMHEIVTNNPKITDKELKQSLWKIAQDTTGTSMNILFFASVIGAFPLVVFLARNNQPIMFNFRHFASAEIVRSLVGSIGIVLAIPVSYYVNLRLRKRRKS